MSIASEIRAMVRREILRALAADEGYAQNHVILRTHLITACAQTLSETEVQDHLSWMEDQKLVHCETAGPFTLARLSDFGLKVAQGREHIDGVERLRPSEVI